MVEYSATVWDPYTKTEIKLIEAVQRRAARYVLNRHHYTSSVGDMLEQLEWTSLEHRRRLSRLSMLYKITNNLVAIQKEQYLKTTSRVSRRCNNQGFYIPQSSADYHLYSFFPRTIREWNALLRPL